MDTFRDPATFIAALGAAGAAVVLAGALVRLAGWPAAVLLGLAVGIPCVIAPDPVLPASVAVTALLARHWLSRGTIQRSAFAGFLPQIAFIVVGYCIYAGSRVVLEAGRSEAAANARDLINFERSMGLFFEGSVQDLFARGLLTDVWNAIYLYAYWPLPIIALFVLYLRDRTGYRILRDGLAVSAVLGLVTIAIFPVVPPRLMPGLEIVDTIEHGRVVSNQFAAVPSLHAGWPALVGLLMFTRGHGWLRVMAPVPGAVMVLTIIVTGNHYWMDAVIGIAFSVVPALYMLAIERVSQRTSQDRTVSA